MRERLNSLLADAAAKYGVSVNPAKLDLFYKYMELLLECNAKFNLTRITDKDEVYIKHYADSLSILPYISDSTDLIDVGAGAGFPGLPAAMARPDLKVTLIDSNGKKVAFLNETIKSLGLENARAFHGRAEDFGRDPDFRGKFGAVTARAVAGLPALIEYCLPFLKINGLFVAMKGGKTEEISASGMALETVGGRLENVVNFKLADSSERNLVLIRKISRTPEKYPRKAGKPSAEPII